jgi:acetyl esterase/lipase
MTARRWFSRQVLWFLAAVACGHHAGTMPDGPGPDAASYMAVELSTQPFSNGGRTWTIHLFRIDRPDGGHTYVEWIPSDTAGARPTLVLTEPYIGIDWTGDPLDTRWAGYTAQSDGLYLDVDGPSYSGTEEISFPKETAAQLANDNSLQLADGFAVAMIFGRYYAGGTIREYVADMAAGMWFVAEQDAVDKARIGVFGASLGGFEGLMTAVHADPRAVPRAVAVAFPVSDWATEATHMATRTGAAQQFMISYLHRIYATTGGPPEQSGTDFSGLRVTDICGHLPSDTLVLHDEGDNLVPIAETQTLVSSCGVTPIYWDRASALGSDVIAHGLLVFEPAPQSYMTFAYSYLALRILAPDQVGAIEAYSPAAMQQQLNTVHAAQLAARDVSFESPRLIELCDARIGMISVDNCTAASCPIVSGASVVAGLVNTVWGTSFTDQTVAAGLASGMPAP